MAESEQLRVYIRYDILLTADLRYVLGGIEQAYNRVDSFLRGPHRRPASSRLQVTSVHTGRSVAIILMGAAQTIVGLYFLYEGARRLHWSTEKLKWEAKLAKKKFQTGEYSEAQERLSSAMQNEDPTVMKALTNIQKVVERIDKSRHITSVEIRLVDQDDAGFDRPRRKISFEDD